MGRIKSIKGAYRNECGELLCNECGSNLMYTHSVEYIAHIDGRNSYGNLVTCKKCDNYILLTFYRYSNQ